MNQTLKILVADDHQLVRKGIVQVLKDGLNFPNVKEVSDSESVLEYLSKEDYDVLLLDVSLPGRSGLDILADIKKLRPAMPVIIISINPVEQFGLRALRQGAAGYIVKDAAPEELILALQQVLKGKRYINSALSELLIQELSNTSNLSRHDALSSRELEVLRCLAKGMSIKSVALQLHISTTTVSTYRSRILEKMNFKNNADLIQYAIENRLNL